MSSTETIIKEITTDKDNSETRAVIAYNNNHTPFDDVRNCLCQYCPCTIEEANNKTLEIHFNGKSIVKVGTYEECLPISDALDKILVCCEIIKL